MDMDMDNNFEAIMDVDSSDEDEEPLSSESDYISDYGDSEDRTQIVCKEVSSAELLALNRRSKQCCLYFYYSAGGSYALCTTCMIDTQNTDVGMAAVRKHVIDSYAAIDGRFCSNCREPLYLIFPAIYVQYVLIKKNNISDNNNMSDNMESIAQVERELLEQSSRVTNLSEYFAWVQQCDECVEKLEDQSRAKRLRLSIGVKQTLVARIARLEGQKIRLERRFIHFGGEYTDNSGDNRAKGLVWRAIETAFKNRIITGAVINADYIEPRRFLEDAASVVLEQVQDVTKRHSSVKINTVFNGEFVSGDKRANKSINTRNCELFNTSNLHEWYERHVLEPTLASLEEFQERDSGWALSRILDLTVNINKYNPMRAGCYLKLPREIMMKRAVINVHAKGNACFAWAVVAALYPAKVNAERESSYQHYSKVLNLGDISFPVTLKDIAKFERLNEVSVNVYGIETRGKETKKAAQLSILPIRLTDRPKDKHVNLLYMPDDRDENVGHFACVKNLSRLVSSQLSRNKCRKYICDRCLHYFDTSEKLVHHTMDCREINDCAVRLPDEKDKWLTFKNYGRKEQVPFIVYADLECILQKQTPEKDLKSYMYQHHQVFSIAYYVHCSYDESLSKFRCRRDPDCVKWFVEELKELACRVKIILKTNVRMETLSKEQWEKFHSATLCHVCDKPFAQDDIRIRDHCHLTGRYRGPAHSNCNLNYKNSYFIPIVFHNLSGYDSHFIIKDLATAFEGSLSVLPITKEKYISFTKNIKGIDEKADSREEVQLRFIDSYKFLSTSLDKLASFLSKEKLKILRSKFDQLCVNDFDLLTRKGIFPYEYLDSVDRLQDTCLPPRESFYSSLTGDTVSESDYAHAENIWQRFSVKTLGEYSDLYLKTDVLLLADIFENFRDSCIISYGLDPAYYYTLPGFTWDAMLKHTRVTLELLTDIDMILFIERGIRGGLSQCSGRYARANNKYM